MRPKIAIVGYPGVGKTTITNLARSINIPLQSISKMNSEIATIKIGKLHFYLWDFSGKEQFRFLWEEFIKGSDAILLITDSTSENAEKSKFFLEIRKEFAPNTNIIAIANKQDLITAKDPKEIEKILGLKTYSLTAIDSRNGEKIIQIITELLNMNYEVSQQISLLNERQNLTSYLEQLIEENNYEVAYSTIEKIEELCTKLEDENLKNEYHEMGQKLNQFLEQGTLMDKSKILNSLTRPDQTKPQEISVKARLLKDLIKNYMNDVGTIIEATICDREGLILTSECKREAGSEEILGAMATVIDDYIERMKKEFEAEGNFFNITMLGDKKIAYCSMGLNSILTSIAEPSTTDVELRVYSEHVASKVELILEGNENIDIKIPQVIKTISKTKGGELPKGDFSAKIIMTGNYQAGKTSLVSRFVQNLFQESYQSTIGVDISEKLVQLSNDTKIKFTIWDIGGQITQMAPYRKRFYEGATSAFIVLDRTKQVHLKSIEIWHEDIKKYVKEDINFIIVGNKSDLVDDITISEEDIKKVADKYGFHYILTSAKTGENVNDAFLYIAYKFLESI